MIAVGIDGGGTRTRIAIDRDGDVTYFEDAISLKVRQHDYLTSAHQLLSVLRKALPDERIDAIAIGLSGMSQRIEQEKFESAIRSLPEFANVHLHIEGDASLTLRAALGDDKDGMLLIAGTGSVTFARKNGELFRVGGWGPTLSDEGSGYWIGLYALQHYIRSIDGSDEVEELSNAIGAELPDAMRGDPAAILHCITDEPAFPASLAYIPFEKLQTSQRAREIIHNAALELEKLVVTARAAAQLPAPVPLYLHGSIAANHVIIAEFRRALDEAEFTIDVVESSAPAYAALKIAQQR